MCRIMVSIDAMVVGLNDHEPRPASQFIAVECVEHVKSLEQFQAQVHQWMFVGQFLETEDLKIPIKGTLQHFGNLSWNFNLGDLTGA